MEIVGAEKRVYCGIAIEVFFVVGEILASGIINTSKVLSVLNLRADVNTLPLTCRLFFVGLAYWLRDWRTIVTVAIGPIFLFLLYWPILPESTR